MTDIKEVVSETVSVSMTEREIHPPCWFACNDRLYLAVEWVDTNGSLILRAVGFNAAGPHASTWRRSEQAKVDLVHDSGVAINYKVLKKSCWVHA